MSIKELMMINEETILSLLKIYKDDEKILKPEKESINILPHFSLLDDAVDKLIEKYDFEP